jgi:hypothetical protein
MRLKEYNQRKHEFALSLLPILQESNFQCKNKDEEIVTRFNKDGFYYCIKVWVYNNYGDTELRVTRCNTEDFNVRFHPVVCESCFVYLLTPYHKVSKKDVAIDKYFIQYYQVVEAQENRCFYCREYWRFKCVKYHNHIKTKRHIQNYNKFMEEFAEQWKVNEDVVKNIMSYLY